eukprot:TRINITY_DN29449_c0_g1_i6.p1 TRINITY_DN29449_c0_g1~~TRINITY_DN29449_c0_g1_i6.p1  ORF type:complete len:2258 (-),score=392.74 TRINITY_DN29449_c0_g1_i6:51-6824(-)
MSQLLLEPAALRFRGMLDVLLLAAAVAVVAADPSHNSSENSWSCQSHHTGRVPYTGDYTFFDHLHGQVRCPAGEFLQGFRFKRQRWDFSAVPVIRKEDFACSSSDKLESGVSFESCVMMAQRDCPDVASFIYAWETGDCSCGRLGCDLANDLEKPGSVLYGMRPKYETTGIKTILSNVFDKMNRTKSRWILWFPVSERRSAEGLGRCPVGDPAYGRSMVLKFLGNWTLDAQTFKWQFLNNFQPELWSVYETREAASLRKGEFECLARSGGFPGSCSAPAVRRRTSYTPFVGREQRFTVLPSSSVSVLYTCCRMPHDSTSMKKLEFDSTNSAPLGPVMPNFQFSCPPRHHINGWNIDGKAGHGKLQLYCFSQPAPAGLATVAYYEKSSMPAKRDELLKDMWLPEEAARIQCDRGSALVNWTKEYNGPGGRLMSFRYWCVALKPVTSPQLTERRSHCLGFGGGHVKPFEREVSEELLLRVTQGGEHALVQSEEFTLTGLYETQEKWCEVLKEGCKQPALLRAITLSGAYLGGGVAKLVVWPASLSATATAGEGKVGCYDFQPSGFRSCPSGHATTKVLLLGGQLQLHFHAAAVSSSGASSQLVDIYLGGETTRLVLRIYDTFMSFEVKQQGFPVGGLCAHSGAATALEGSNVWEVGNTNFENFLSLALTSNEDLGDLRIRAQTVNSFGPKDVENYGNNCRKKMFDKPLDKLTKEEDAFLVACTYDHITLGRRLTNDAADMELLHRLEAAAEKPRVMRLTGDKKVQAAEAAQLCGTESMSIVLPKTPFEYQLMQKQLLMHVKNSLQGKQSGPRVSFSDLVVLGAKRSPSDPKWRTMTGEVYRLEKVVPPDKRAGNISDAQNVTNIEYLCQKAIGGEMVACKEVEMAFAYCAEKSYVMGGLSTGIRIRSACGEAAVPAMPDSTEAQGYIHAIAKMQALTDYIYLGGVLSKGLWFWLDGTAIEGFTNWATENSSRAAEQLDGELREQVLCMEVATGKWENCGGLPFTARSLSVVCQTIPTGEDDSSQGFSCSPGLLSPQTQGLKDTEIKTFGNVAMLQDFCFYLAKGSQSCDYACATQLPNGECNEDGMDFVAQDMENCKAAVKGFGGLSYNDNLTEELLDSIPAGCVYREQETRRKTFNHGVQLHRSKSKNVSKCETWMEGPKSTSMFRVCACQESGAIEKGRGFNFATDRVFKSSAKNYLTLPLKDSTDQPTAPWKETIADDFTLSLWISVLDNALYSLRGPAALISTIAESDEKEAHSWFAGRRRYIALELTREGDVQLRLHVGASKEDSTMATKVVARQVVTHQSSGKWHHVAATFSRDRQRASLYIDARQYQTIAYAPETDNPGNDGWLYIGGGSNGQDLTCRLAHFQIWKGEFQADVVKEMFGEGLCLGWGPDTNSLTPLGLYRLSEDVKNTLPPEQKTNFGDLQQSVAEEVPFDAEMTCPQSSCRQVKCRTGYRPRPFILGFRCKGAKCTRDECCVRSPIPAMSYGAQVYLTYTEGHQGVGSPITPSRPYRLVRHSYSCANAGGRGDTSALSLRLTPHEPQACANYVHYTSMCGRFFSYNMQSGHCDCVPAEALDCELQAEDPVVRPGWSAYELLSAECDVRGCWSFSKSKPFGFLSAGMKDALSFFVQPKYGQVADEGTCVSYGDEVTLAVSGSRDFTSDCGWYGCEVATLNGSDRFALQLGMGGEQPDTFFLQPLPGRFMDIGCIRNGSHVVVSATNTPNKTSVCGWYGCLVAYPDESSECSGRYLFRLANPLPEDEDLPEVRAQGVACAYKEKLLEPLGSGFTASECVREVVARCGGKALAQYAQLNGVCMCIEDGCMPEGDASSTIYRTGTVGTDFISIGYSTINTTAAVSVEASSGEVATTLIEKRLAIRDDDLAGFEPPLKKERTRCKAALDDQLKSAFREWKEIGSAIDCMIKTQRYPKCSHTEFAYSKSLRLCECAMVSGLDDVPCETAPTTNYNMYFQVNQASARVEEELGLMCPPKLAQDGASCNKGTFAAANVTLARCQALVRSSKVCSDPGIFAFRPSDGACYCCPQNATNGVNRQSTFNLYFAAEPSTRELRLRFGHGGTVPVILQVWVMPGKVEPPPAEIESDLQTLPNISLTFSIFNLEYANLTEDQLSSINSTVLTHLVATAKIPARNLEVILAPSMYKRGTVLVQVFTAVPKDADPDAMEVELQGAACRALRSKVPSSVLELPSIGQARQGLGGRCLRGCFAAFAVKLADLGGETWSSSICDMAGVKRWLSLGLVCKS